MTPESPSCDIPVNKRGQNLLCRCRLQSDSIRNSQWLNLTSISQITNNSLMFCPFSFYARLSRHSAAQLCVEASVKVAEQILTVYSFSRSRADCTALLFSPSSMPLVLTASIWCVRCKLHTHKVQNWFTDATQHTDAWMWPNDHVLCTASDTLSLAHTVKVNIRQAPLQQTSRYVSHSRGRHAVLYVGMFMIYSHLCRALSQSHSLHSAPQLVQCSTVILLKQHQKQ